MGGGLGSATWGTMPAAVGKTQYAVHAPGWWVLWESGRSRENASLIWYTASGCMVDG